MNARKFRLVSLCLALTLSILAGRSVHALPTCPPRLCSNVASSCTSLGCGFSLTPNGQCVDGSGAVHNYYIARCPACNITTDCYIP